MQQPDKHYLGQVTKTYTNIINMLISMCPCHDVMRMALYLCGLPPKERTSPV